MNLMRRIRKLNEEIEFPLTTGRDFSGIVVAKGHIVGSKFELGDEVWGVVPVEQQGCHATHVVVDSDLVKKNFTISIGIKIKKNTSIFLNFKLR